MLASIFSAVCIVLLNKTLFATYDFKFPVTLTGWHLCFTAATLVAACRMGRGSEPSIHTTHHTRIHECDWITVEIHECEGIHST